MIAEYRHKTKGILGYRFCCDTCERKTAMRKTDRDLPAHWIFKSVKAKRRRYFIENVYCPKCKKAAGERSANVNK